MENQKSLQWFYREIPTATWSGLIHSWVNASRCSSEWVARFQCNMYHVLLVRSLLLLRCCFVSDFHSTHGLTFLAAVLSSFFQFQRSQNLLLCMEERTSWLLWTIIPFGSKLVLKTVDDDGFHALSSITKGVFFCFFIYWIQTL